MLKGARKTNRQEWKVFLESVLLELRSQDVPRALREARKALVVHRAPEGYGRPHPGGSRECGSAACGSDGGGMGAARLVGGALEPQPAPCRC